MTDDQLETLAGKAGMYTDLMHMGAASMVYSPGCNGVNLTELKRFVALVEELARRTPPAVDAAAEAKTRAALEILKRYRGGGLTLNHEMLNALDAALYRPAKSGPVSATSEPVSTPLRPVEGLDQDSAFEAVWDAVIAENSGHQIGADYKHWMRLGWREGRAGAAAVRETVLAEVPLIAEAIRAKTLEEAAKLCEAERNSTWNIDQFGWVAEQCADAIRELATKPAQENDHGSV